MTKNIMLISLFACFVFALNVNAVDKPDVIEFSEGVGVKQEPSIAEKPKGFFRSCLLYISNRIDDGMDMFSFNVNAGDFFEFQMQATRYIQFGGAVGESFFTTKAYSRQYGFGDRDIHRFGFGFWEQDVTIVNKTSEHMRDYMIYFPNYLSFVDNVANRNLYAFTCGDVDFWKVGIDMGWFIGGGFGIHPIEVADFFTGFIFIDISNDDF